MSITLQQNNKKKQNNIFSIDYNSIYVIMFMGDDYMNNLYLNLKNLIAKSNDDDDDEKIIFN